MAEATTSFPVPLSPRTTTGTVERATACARESASARDGTSVANPLAAGASELDSTTSPLGRTRARKRKKVWPSSMRSPSWSSARWHRRPLTSVPFFEPRSSMVQEPSTLRSSACEADIQASSTPMVRRGTPDPSPREMPGLSARPSITSSTCSSEQRIAAAPGRSQLSTRKT